VVHDLSEIKDCETATSDNTGGSLLDARVVSPRSINLNGDRSAGLAAGGVAIKIAPLNQIQVPSKQDMDY